MPKKRTEAEFIRLLNKKQENQYELLTHYINNTTKVKIECRNCGMLFSVIPKELLKRRYGKNCNHRLPLSEKQVKAKIKFATNGKIKMIGAYKGVREKNFIRMYELPL